VAHMREPAGSKHPIRGIDEPGDRIADLVRSYG
jgi:hypothetical protein